MSILSGSGHGIWRPLEGGQTINDVKITSHYPTSPLFKVAVRLNHPEGQKLPFQYIDVHKVSDEKYFVFVVQNGEYTVIEDGDLFPSDALITQLRLLKG